MVLFPEARAGLVAGILAADKYNADKTYVFDGRKEIELRVCFVVEHPGAAAPLLAYDDPLAVYEELAAGAGPVDVLITAECDFGEDLAGAERHFTVDCFSDMKDCMDAVVGALARAAVTASYRDDGTEVVAVEAAAQEFCWDPVKLREAEIMLGPVDIYRRQELARALA